MQATDQARQLRMISHERALEAAQRFIDYYFRNKSGRGEPVACVPAQLNDDDLVLVDYIRQQKERDRLRR